ncbi:MAG: hypothetical protein HWE23_11680 [Rhodobacteraceae bacterium]|nr:hypothetical protein [Paracoccaceae bacterium]
MVMSAATRDVRGVFRRAKRNAAIITLASLCFVTAYVAGIVAVGIYLTPIYGAGPAVLGIAAVMAATGLLCLGVLSALKYRDKRRAARRRSAQKLAAAAAISIIPQLAKSKGLMALAAVGGLAFLMSRGGDDEDEA